MTLNGAVRDGLQSLHCAVNCRQHVCSVYQGVHASISRATHIGRLSRAIRRILRGVMLLVVHCLTSQQQASVSHGRICSDNFKCCHTETEVADPTFHLTQSQYTDTEPTSPSADPITQAPGGVATGVPMFMTRPRKNPGASGIRTRDLPLSRRTPYH